jgi:hypothetical protein
MRKKPPKGRPLHDVAVGACNERYLQLLRTAARGQRRGLSPWTSPYLDGDAGLDTSVSRTVPRHDRRALWPNRRDGAGRVHGCDGRVR